MIFFNPHPAARTPDPIILIGTSIQQLSLYDLCSYAPYFGYNELLAALILVIWSFLRIPQSCDFRVWIPSAVLTVMSILRSGISVVAPRICTRLRMTDHQWRPKVIVFLTTSSVFLILSSYAVIVGQEAVLASWRSASEHAQCGEDHAGMLSRWRGTMFRVLVGVAHMLSIGLWFVHVPTLPTPPAPKGTCLPKPRVTSFVVRDVCLECRSSTCAICLDEISSGCWAGRLPCDHVYHDQCIRSWLDSGHATARCPMRCPSATSSSPYGCQFEGRTVYAWPEGADVTQDSNRVEIV